MNATREAMTSMDAIAEVHANLAERSIDLSFGRETERDGSSQERQDITAISLNDEQRYGHDKKPPDAD